MKKEKHFGLRIEADLLKKSRVVCGCEGRSANAQILYLMRQCVEEYEKEDGEIKGRV